jgi:hypothetical protein
MIDVVYHGELAWRDATRINHDRMLNLLRQNWPVQVHWRDTIDTDESCEFDRSGPCEIWKFYQRMRDLRNPIVVYVSTEVWFGAGAAEAVLAEVSRVIEGESDVAFLGSDFREGWGEQHERRRITKHERLGEHVVVARRHSINDPDQAMQNLRTGKQFKDTGRSWPAIIRDADRADTIRCQTYLVRRIDHQLTDWRVGWDYLRTVDHSDEALTWWIMNQPRDQRM